MDENIAELPDYRDLAADIVAAYVSHNALSPTDIPKLLTDTHNQLRSLGKLSEAPAPWVRPVPAVAINRSVRDAAITCLDCGRAFKSLKRHIYSKHDMTSTAYNRSGVWILTTRWWHRLTRQHDPLWLRKLV